MSSVTSPSSPQLRCVYRQMSRFRHDRAVAQVFREEMTVAWKSGRALTDSSDVSCPPSNLAPLQDFDLANFVSAPWYAQAMVRPWAPACVITRIEGSIMSASVAHLCSHAQC